MRRILIVAKNKTSRYRRQVCHEEHWDRFLRILKNYTGIPVQYVSWILNIYLCVLLYSSLGYRNCSCNPYNYLITGSNRLITIVIINDWGSISKIDPAGRIFSLFFFTFPTPSPFFSFKLLKNVLFYCLGFWFPPPFRNSIVCFIISSVSLCIFENIPSL